MKTYCANSQFKMLVTLFVLVLGVFYLNSKFNFLKLTTTPKNETVISTNSVKITNSNNEVKTVEVEIANTESSRQQGLMNRTYLGENSGMLFVFDSDVQTGFWMKNTLIPLDLIYIDNNLKIVDIKENFIQCTTATCPLYLAKAPFRYVLEVNSGWSSKNSVKVGDSVVISTYAT
ncbi:DUF192 domain-containing protein [Candidatus Dojkabacteria bacterium]|jgi:hypothetical protein|nr:DUF192 domain-containing protein [Candidatus Dojkabacteria bacterium]